MKPKPYSDRRWYEPPAVTSSVSANKTLYYTDEEKQYNKSYLEKVRATRKEQLSKKLPLAL